MSYAPTSAMKLTAIQVGASVDEDGKPVGILTLETLEGVFDFVITNKVADSLVEAMCAIKDDIKSN